VANSEQKVVQVTKVEGSGLGVSDSGPLRKQDKGEDNDRGRWKSVQSTESLGLRIQGRGNVRLILTENAEARRGSARRGV